MADVITLKELNDCHFSSKLQLDLLGDLTVVVDGIPDYSKQSYEITATGTETPNGYPLIDGTNLTLRQVTLSLKFDGRRGEASGTLNAVIIRDDTILEITVELGSHTEKVAASLSKGKILGFHEVLGLFDIRPHPPLPPDMPNDMDLTSLGLTLDFQARVITMTGETRGGMAATILAKDEEDGWQVALIVDRPRGWKGDDLGGAMAAVNDFATFDAAVVALASHDVTFIDGDIHTSLGDKTLILQAGLNVALSIEKMGSTLAKAVEAAFGVQSLLLEASINPSQRAVQFTAVLGDLSIKLRKDVSLKIRGANLNLNTGPSIEVEGTVEFPMPDKTRTEVYGSVSITVDGLQFNGQLDKDIPIVKGLMLQHVAASFGFVDAEFSLGFGGQVLVDGATLGGGLQMSVPIFEPLFGYVEMKNVHLSALFAQLYPGKSLPAAIRKAVYIKTATVSDCNETGGCKLGEITSDFGSHIAGQARLFGFDVSAGLKISESGLSGSMDIKEPLTPKTTGIVGFELTAADDHKRGPHFMFATEGSKLLDVNLRMAVFGVDASAGVKLTDKGFTAGTSIRFEGNSVTVACFFKPAPKGFVAGVGIDTTFAKPIVIKPGGHKVTIKTLTVSMDTKRFHYQVTGTKPPLSSKLNVSGSVSFDSMGHDLNKLIQAITKDAGKRAT